MGCARCGELEKHTAAGKGAERNAKITQHFLNEREELQAKLTRACDALRPFAEAWVKDKPVTFWNSDQFNGNQSLLKAKQVLREIEGNHDKTHSRS